MTCRETTKTHLNRSRDTLISQIINKQQITSLPLSRIHEGSTERPQSFRTKICVLNCWTLNHDPQGIKEHFSFNLFILLFFTLSEGCPIHPTRVDSSLVFAIRLTGNIFLNPLLWNRHESFRLVSIRYTGSRFARDLENIAPRVYAGWVENVVDSTRFDRIDTNRFTLCRFVIPEVDLRET